MTVRQREKRNKSLLSVSLGFSVRVMLKTTQLTESKDISLPISIRVKVTISLFPQSKDGETYSGGIGEYNE